MKNEPLFLPKGSIRAIIALIVTIFICVALFFSITLPEFIVVAWSGIVSLYFASRSNFNDTKINE